MQLFGAIKDAVFAPAAPQHPLLPLAGDVPSNVIEMDDLPSFAELTADYYNQIVEKKGNGKVSCWDWCDNTCVTEHQTIFRTIHDIRWLPVVHPLCQLLSHRDRRRPANPIYYGKYIAILDEREVVLLLLDICNVCKKKNLPLDEVVDEAKAKAICCKAKYVDEDTCVSAQRSAEGSDVEEDDGDEGNSSSMMEDLLNLRDPTVMRSYVNDVYQQARDAAPGGTLPSAKDFNYDMILIQPEYGNPLVGEDTLELWCMPIGHILIEYLEASGVNPYMIVETDYGICAMYATDHVDSAIHRITQTCAMYGLGIVGISNSSSTNVVADANNNNNAPLVHTI